jgi:hypothetical protein
LIPWQSLAKLQPIAENYTKNRLHDGAIEFWNAAAKKTQNSTNIYQGNIHRSTADIAWSIHNIAYNEGVTFMCCGEIHSVDSVDLPDLPRGGKGCSCPGTVRGWHT